jgi:Holliday junction resolvasome RuvABC endonuclease subunit
MHLMPTGAGDLANLIGIDPGTEMLGVACITFSVTTLEIHSTTAETFSGSKLPLDRWLAEVHTHRIARLEAHKLNLLRIFRQVNPIAVVCETPYFNRRMPSAFEALVQAMNAIRFAVWEYDPYLQLDTIDPSGAKKAAGVVGKIKGKDKKSPVRDAILALTEIKYAGAVPLEMLDEHSIDSIAVAYSKLLEYRKGNHVW